MQIFYHLKTETVILAAENTDYKILHVVKITLVHKIILNSNIKAQFKLETMTLDNI